MLSLLSITVCAVKDRKPRDLACTPAAWAHAGRQVVAQWICFQFGRLSLQRGFQISSLAPCDSLGLILSGTEDLLPLSHCGSLICLHLEPKVQVPFSFTLLISSLWEYPGETR